jgi:hypothetical protein
MGGMLTLGDGVDLTVAIAPLIAVTTVVFAIAHVLHLAVAVDRAPRPIAVTALVVTLTTVILAGRCATLATRRGAATTGRANNATVRTIAAAVGTVATVTATLGTLTTGAVTARVEAP